MGWRRRAGGGKRDSAEGPIVAGLRAVGVDVRLIGGTGNPDLLCGYRGRWTPLEVKTGKGGRTKNQTDIPWAVVTTLEQALREIGAIQ